MGAIVIFVYGVIFIIIPNTTTIYPIGHDTSAYLANLKLMYEINSKSSYVYAFPLLPFFFSVLYSFGVNMVMLLKIYSIVAYGFAGVSVYYYARKGLEWNLSKSVLAGTIFLSSPITLRIGWELHSQLIATISFFVALAQLNLLLKIKDFTLKSVLRRRQFLLIIGLTIAIGWLHLLISSLFLFILLSEFVLNIIERKKQSIVFLFCGLVLVLATLFFSIILAPEPMTPANPRNLQAAIGFTRPEYANGIFWLLSLISFSYAFIIPLAILGIFRKPQILLMVIFPTLFLFLYLVSPSMPFIPPERNVYLYEYPLCLFAANGIYWLKNQAKNIKKPRSFQASFSIDSIIVAILLIPLIFQSLNMTGLFQPIGIFSDPPPGYPPNIQWAGVSISEIEDVIYITNWYNEISEFNSLLIVPDGSFGWVKYHLKDGLPVVKWSIFNDPYGTPLLLQNGSLILVPGELPVNILQEKKLQGFDNFYIMHMPSWDIADAIQEIYPRLEKISSQGNVVLYKIENC